MLGRWGAAVAELFAVEAAINAAEVEAPEDVRVEVAVAVGAEAPTEGVDIEAGVPTDGVIAVARVSRQLTRTGRKSCSS